jgi:hypothetical protein
MKSINSGGIMGTKDTQSNQQGTENKSKFSFKRNKSAGKNSDEISDEEARRLEEEEQCENFGDNEANY